jgi:hypothetical protein
MATFLLFSRSRFQSRKCITKPSFLEFIVYGVLCHFQQYFSYIVVVSFIGVGNLSTRRKPMTCRKSLTNFITQRCIEYTSPWMGLKLTTLVVIGTDRTGSYKSNYHTITTTTALFVFRLSKNQTGHSDHVGCTQI